MEFKIRSLNAGRFLDLIRGFSKEREIIIASLKITPDEDDIMRSIIILDDRIVSKMELDLIEKLCKL